ncbi:hypothetical protein R84B8_02508 [Treponema sp. R8-4-B8]
MKPWDGRFENENFDFENDYFDIQNDIEDLIKYYGRNERKIVREILERYEDDDDYGSELEDVVRAYLKRRM